MMYSEFAAATKCSNTEHNREVFHHLEALYMMSDMTKEEVYRIGRKLVVNPVVYNDRLGEEGGRYVFVTDGTRTPNGCYYIGTWAEVLDWEIKISTATSVYKLRALSQGEANSAIGWDCYLASHADFIDYDSWEGKHVCHDSFGYKSKIKWIESK